jgi:Family of unknown function (DUF5675)
MQLKLVRQVFTQNSTIGRLFIDGEFECHTLEDMVRPEKIYGETAIPAGTYQVVISMSERFKTRLPLLVDVPGYTGVRIHPGNTKADTLGCILVGQSRGTDSIGASRAAFGVLLPKLEAAAAREKLVIDIVEERADAAPTTRGRKRAPAPVAPAAKRAPVVEAAKARSPAVKATRAAKLAKPAEPAKPAKPAKAAKAAKPAEPTAPRGRTRGA